MDALIMAAGRGSRLGAETDERPKVLVDLGGTTPIEFQLDLLANRGVRRATVVTGYRRELVHSAVEEAAAGRMEVNVVWNPFWSATNVLGSAWMARADLGESFIYLHADTIFDPSILDDLLTDDSDAVLPIDVRACEPEQMKAQVKGNSVVRLSKDLPAAETAGEFIGLGRFAGTAVNILKEGMDAVLDQGILSAYFEEAINWGITHRGLDVRSIATAGRAWTEIDFPEDLALARRILPMLRR